MPRRALLIGINKYDDEHVSDLTGCVADATAMRDLLERHEDGSRNYDCRLLVSPGAEPITRKLLRAQWNKLFGDFAGDILFYFSGHGTPLRTGGFLVTQDGDPDDPGLAMDELLTLANWSRAQSVLLILDCCNSGYLGNPSNLQGAGSLQSQAQLREGVTVLAASRPAEAAIELYGHGVFTQLVLGALSGGAADVRGLVSAASIYAYAEQALGSWDQRPMYKSHAAMLPPVRICRPAVPDALLRELPSLFTESEGCRQIDPTYETSHPSADPDHVALFDNFKTLRNARLLVTEDGSDLFHAAVHSGRVRLTPLGRFYRRLAETERI
jgi:hypothetical protein